MDFYTPIGEVSEVKIPRMNQIWQKWTGKQPKGTGCVIECTRIRKLANFLSSCLFAGLYVAIGPIAEHSELAAGSRSRKRFSPECEKYPCLRPYRADQALDAFEMDFRTLILVGQG